MPGESYIGVKTRRLGGDDGDVSANISPVSSPGGADTLGKWPNVISLPEASRCRNLINSKCLSRREGVLKKL